MEKGETGLVLKELSYKDGKETISPVISFDLIKKFKIKKSLFVKEIEVEFN